MVLRGTTPRHALKVLQPTSKPGRPHQLTHQIHYTRKGSGLMGFLFFLFITVLMAFADRFCHLF